MKRTLLISLIFLAVTGFGFINKTRAQRFEYNQFYISLAPHGSWIEIDNGLLAWRPNRISARWAPYQAGRWVWTSYGWYWDSFEPFGDITYHYGRWYYDDYYGWMWIPDNEWGPAWVEWRYDDDYIGWAPLSPYATFSVSVGIRFTHSYQSPWRVWNFVRYHHFCEGNLNAYYIPAAYKQRFFSNTKYRNDYSYEGNRIINRGVDRTIIERRGNISIREREVVRVSNPRGEVRRPGDRVEVYAPSRDVLTRGDISAVKIERSERKTALDIRNVNIGRNETVRARDNNRSVEVKRETTPAVTGRETRTNTNPVRVEREVRKTETPQKVEAQRNRVEERSAPARENRGTVKEQRVREERKQEVRENRNEKRNTENRGNTESRAREQRNDSRDARTR
jgi:hypothetical protein